MTLTEQYEARGYEKGFQIGLQEGFQEGVLIGQVRLLQQVLRRPMDDESFLETLSTKQLEALFANLKRDLGIS